jgi:hypothetical protein
MSWKADVVADSSGEWVSNALRFGTKQEAIAYANNLAMRWTLVRDLRVTESVDPVNYWFHDGKLVAVKNMEG